MKRLALLVAVITVLSYPIVGMSADRSWYAGVAAGISSLRPETKNSPFSVESSLSSGAGLFVGYDYSPRFSFEGGYSFLGNATLSGANGRSNISYSALSAGALVYVYGDQTDIAQRSGFAGYLRLGLNSINNSTSIPVDRDDNVAIWAGVGVEWPITKRVSARGEISSFDGDAQTARLAFVYRPNNNASVSPVVREPKSTAQVDSAPTQEDPVPTREETAAVQDETAPEPIESVPAPAPAPTIEQPPVEEVQPSTTIENPDCVVPAPNEPIDSQGCGLFGGVLTGVNFTSGTANLTLEGSRLLDQLSENLLAYSAIKIEIQAHTESFGDEAQSNEIAKLRTLTVARHLVGRGVPVNRLKARAFGHAQPLVPDATVAGRLQNNRIVLRVLP